jgi:hypothetical protein
MNISGCKREGSSTSNCTFTVENQPYVAHLEGTKGGNTSISALRFTNPKWHMACGSLINCTYRQEAVELEGVNGSPTQFLTNNLSIAKISGTFCPSTTNWNATYSANTTIAVH